MIEENFVLLVQNDPKDEDEDEETEEQRAEAGRNFLRNIHQKYNHNEEVRRYFLFFDKRAKKKTFGVFSRKRTKTVKRRRKQQNLRKRKAQEKKRPIGTPNVIQGKKKKDFRVDRFATIELRLFLAQNDR